MREQGINCQKREVLCLKIDLADNISTLSGWYKIGCVREVAETDVFLTTVTY